MEKRFGLAEGSSQYRASVFVGLWERGCFFSSSSFLFIQLGSTHQPLASSSSPNMCTYHNRKLLPSATVVYTSSLWHSPGKNSDTLLNGMPNERAPFANGTKRAAPKSFRLVTHNQCCFIAKILVL